MVNEAEMQLPEKASLIKILLADDDHEDQFIINEAFSAIGKEGQIVFVSDGEDVIPYLEMMPQNHELPSLIVLDLNMPRMNGTTALKTLKLDDRYAHIPVIIFSTSVNAIEKTVAMEHGAVHYITKPVTYKESLDIARQFYDFSVDGV